MIRTEARPYNELEHWTALFGLCCLLFALRPPLHGNELETLLFARAHADAAFLKGDWFFTQPSGSRLPTQIIIWPLFAVLPLPKVAFATRILGYAWVSFGLARLSSKLGLRIGESLLALGVFFFANQSIAAGEWFAGTFESKVVAYGFLFLALAALIDRKLVQCAVFAALATVFQPLVGGAGSLALLAAAAVFPPERRDVMRAAAAWLVLVVPAALLLSIAVGGAKIAQIGHAAAIAVFFRNPHHTDPFFFLGRLYYYALATPALTFAIELGSRNARLRRIAVLLAPLALIAAYSSSRDLGTVVAMPFMLWIALRAVLDRSEEIAPVIIGAFSVGSFVLFYVGLVAALVPGGVLLLQLYPFRLADSLLLLFSLMLGIRMTTRMWPPVTASRIAAAMGAIVLLWGVTASVSMIRHGSFRVERPPEFAWIETHTPATARVLVSPAIAEASLYMRRPTVVAFKFFPYTVNGINEWYRRITDMAGGDVPAGQGFDEERAIEARFLALTPAQYQSLARRYDASYLVVPLARKLPFQRMYTAQTYSVYRIPSAAARY